MAGAEGSLRGCGSQRGSSPLCPSGQGASSSPPGRQGREEHAARRYRALGHERARCVLTAMRSRCAWSVESTGLTARMFLLQKAREVGRDQATKSLELLVVLVRVGWMCCITNIPKYQHLQITFLYWCHVSVITQQGDCSLMSLRDPRKWNCSHLECLHGTEGKRLLYGGIELPL